VETHNCCSNIGDYGAGAVFYLNVQWERLFSFLDEKDVHLMEQCYPISLLKVK
jgi:hypothetical protein